MKTKVIVRQNNFWGSGEDLREAKANYRKASGRNYTSQASIIAFKGSQESVDSVAIDDVMGDIAYNKDLQAITIQ